MNGTESLGDLMWTRGYTDPEWIRRFASADRPELHLIEHEGEQDAEGGRHSQPAASTCTHWREPGFATALTAIPSATIVIA